MDINLKLNYYNYPPLKTKCRSRKIYLRNQDSKKTQHVELRILVYSELIHNAVCAQKHMIYFMQLLYWKIRLLGKLAEPGLGRCHFR